MGIKNWMKKTFYANLMYNKYLRQPTSIFYTFTIPVKP
jgi:hypothetical protein